jgi:ABC-type dipeptide/oligopeptide/nickel transport system permease component
MLTYAFRSVFVVILGILFSFALFYVLPDPAYRVAGGFADKATVASIRKNLHLDEPITKRFVTLVSDTASGRLKSFYTNRPVIGLAIDKLKVSLAVAGWGLVFIFVLGGLLVAGQGMSRRLKRWIEMLSNTAAVVPVFISAILLLFASTKWGLPKDACAGLALAIFPSILLSSNVVLRLEEAKQAPHTLIARAFGLGMFVMFRRMIHELAPSFIILSNALIFFLIAGLAVVEEIFGIPGIGHWFLQSALRLDLPVLFAVSVLLSLGVVALDMFNKIVVWVLDPRQRNAW